MFKYFLLCSNPEISAKSQHGDNEIRMEWGRIAHCSLPLPLSRYLKKSLFIYAFDFSKIIDMKYVLSINAYNIIIDLYRLFILVA